MGRVVSLIILISMMLHSASRLGILSQIYQERHSIAYTVGLIAEIPIALCSSDYDFNKGLSIQHDDQKTNPSGLAQAQEINLFIPDSNATVLMQADLYLMGVFQKCPYTAIAFQNPQLEIFQPPKIS